MKEIFNIQALPGWVGHTVAWLESIALIIGLLVISFLLTAILIYVIIKAYQFCYCYTVIIKEKVKKVKINKKHKGEH
jgi:predicted membrane protein